jgi:dTDP-4-dehydrorhamnose 3,5-epimerase
VLFESLEVSGAYLISPERIEDERGFFARSWSRDIFATHGLNPNVAQCNISFNKTKGTLRGMHYQAPPYEETKLVRCTQGSIYDVVVDLRSDSPTFKKHDGATLSADNRLMLYVPEGCAHGFITLENDVEIFYQISEFYTPSAQRGVRYDDPAFEIEWPEAVAVINPRDKNYPDFTE